MLYDEDSHSECDEQSYSPEHSPAPQRKTVNASRPVRRRKLPAKLSELERFPMEELTFDPSSKFIPHSIVP